MLIAHKPSRPPTLTVLYSLVNLVVITMVILESGIILQLGWMDGGGSLEKASSSVCLKFLGLRKKQQSSLLTFPRTSTPMPLICMLARGCSSNLKYPLHPCNQSLLFQFLPPRQYPLKPSLSPDRPHCALILFCSAFLSTFIKFTCSSRKKLNRSLYFLLPCLPFQITL